MITILTKADLIREANDFMIEDIDVTHVKYSLEPIQRSGLVLLVADGKLKVLKDRGLHLGIFHIAAMELLITQYLEKHG